MNAKKLQLKSLRGYGPYLATLEWNRIPVYPENPVNHKFSLLNTIEEASCILRTNPGIELETVVIGRRVCADLVVLPQFIEARRVEATNLLPMRGRLTELGKIGARAFLLDMSQDFDNVLILRNSRHAVLVRIIERHAPQQQQQSPSPFTDTVVAPASPKKKKKTPTCS